MVWKTDPHIDDDVVYRKLVFWPYFFFTIFMKIHMETVERLAEETDGFMILFLKFHFKLINIYSLYNYFFWMLYFNEFNELI